VKPKVEYWRELSKSRKTLLVTGLVIFSPVILGLVLVTSCREAWQFTMKTNWP